MKTTKKPLAVGGVSLYPYDAELAKRFTTSSRFGDPLPLYKVYDSVSGQRLIGLPRAVCPLPEDEDYDMRSLGSGPVEFRSTITPRSPDQARVMDEAVALLTSPDYHEGFMIDSPTGSGKTVIAMKCMAALGLKTMVVIHKEDLKDQWIGGTEQSKGGIINLLGVKPEEIGYLQGDICDVSGKKVVFAMLQSLWKDKYPKEILDEFGLTIFDECHRVAADQFKECIPLITSKYRIGLSATTERRDGKDIIFSSHIGPVKVRGRIRKIVPKVLIINTDFKVPVVQRWDKSIGNYRPMKLPHDAGKTMHLSVLMAKDARRNQIIIDFVASAYKRGRNIIVFSDLAVAKHLGVLRDGLLMKGIPNDDIADYVGGLSTAQREKAKSKRVLLSTYKYAAEGTDIPWLDTAVLCHPKADVEQTVGRILREYPDKKAVLLDLHDVDSQVFIGYAKKRLKWYREIGAEVEWVN